MPCGVMVALRILVPSVRVRVLPRQQRANHPYGGLLFFFLSPPEIVATNCGTAEICCKFCKMCVKLKSFVVKNDTIFARNYWRRFLF